MKYLFKRCFQLSMAIFLMTHIAAAEKSGQQPATQANPYQTTEVKKGDRCIVCDNLLTDNGIVILYKGRRVPLMDKAMLDKFLQNPEAYFNKLQATGALFHEEAIVAKGIRLGWFILGLWVFGALIAAAWISNLALRKGLSATRWYFIGLLTSFLGVFWVLKQSTRQVVELPPHLAKIPNTAPPVDCPKCGSQNHPSAERCLGCGAELQPIIESEVKRAGLS